MKTVADRAGVSLPTVSQVIRGVGRISATTRKRVLDAAQSVNYIRNTRAAAVRSGKSHEVGIIVHRIANPFNAELISGVADTLEAVNYVLTVLDARDDAKRLQQHLKLLLGKSIDGLLWVPVDQPTAEITELMLTHRIPAVTFLRDSGDSRSSNISIANAEAVFAATEYLIELNHSRIAFLGGAGNTLTRTSRLQGYHAALAAANISYRKVIDCDDSKNAGFTTILTLRQQAPEVTAAICNGDETAIGALLGLQRISEQAGKNFSIIGFDDTAEAKLVTPSLTTLRVNPYQFGQKLAKMLLDRIVNADAPVIKERIRAKLVIRQSTGHYLGDVTGNKYQREIK